MRALRHYPLDSDADLFEPSWDALLYWLGEVDATVIHAQHQGAAEWIALHRRVQRSMFADLPDAGGVYAASASCPRHGLTILHSGCGGAGTAAGPRMLHVEQGGAWLHLDRRRDAVEEMTVVASSDEHAERLRGLLGRLHRRWRTDTRRAPCLDLLGVPPTPAPCSGAGR